MTTDSVFVSISSVCQKKPPFTCVRAPACWEASRPSSSSSLDPFRDGCRLSVFLLFFRSSAPELQTLFSWQVVSGSSVIRRAPPFFFPFCCCQAWGGVASPLVSCRFYAFVSCTFTTLFNLKTNTC